MSQLKQSLHYIGNSQTVNKWVKCVRFVLCAMKWLQVGVESDEAAGLGRFLEVGERPVGSEAVLVN